MAKSTLYTLNNTPMPKFDLFRSLASHFQGTMLLKIGKIGNAPINLALTLYT